MVRDFGVLTTTTQLLTALRVLRHNRGLKVPVHRFLEVASEPDMGDILFYTVYKFFQSRSEIPPSCAKVRSALAALSLRLSARARGPMAFQCALSTDLSTSSLSCFTSAFLARQMLARASRRSE